MKKSLLIIAFGFAAVFIMSCASKKVVEIPEETEPAVKVEKVEIKEPPVKNDSINEPDITAYAAFVNKLAVENQMTTFLWDCSSHMDRKNLTVKYPSYIDAIINAYTENDEPGNSGDDKTFEEESAYEAVANFRAGWNLGNTLDATSYKEEENEKDEVGWIIKYGKKDSTGKYFTSNWEKAWGQPLTTQEIADFILDAGFNSIRIPVTWAEHLDENNNVHKEWMNRVKETVDYFYNRGVYCIVNVHHDGGSNGWIKATEESYTKYSERFEKLWTQIAQTFIDYDERLLFESMNEILDAENKWNAPTDDAAFWTNKYNQLFVDAVRKTGGNNAKRNLVVMTYAGGTDEGNFAKFVIPEDIVENHLILEVHNYDPTSFTWTDVTWSPMTARWKPEWHEKILIKNFNVCKLYSEKMNIPVIIGEYNATPKKYSDYEK